MPTTIRFPRALIGGAALALVLGVGATSGPAGAAEYPPQPGTTVSDTTPSPGQSIVVSGVTEPNTLVTVTLSTMTPAGGLSAAGGLSPAAVTDYTLGSTISDAVGLYSLTVTIPSNLAAGQYAMVAVANGSVISTTTLAVSPAGGNTSPIASQTPSAGQLPVTGGDSVPMAAVALGAIGAGGALVVVSRRLRERPAVQPTAR